MNLLFNWNKLVSVNTAFQLALIGLVLLVWVIIGDRSRGRRRCPKCWYDMVGVPDRTCPECGNAARKERHFFRTRRTRWKVVLAITVLLSSAALWVIAKVHHEGPLSIVPTTILLYRAPGTLFPYPPTEPWSAELFNRMQQPGVWQWQWSLWLSKQEKLLGAPLVRCPTTWPSDLPLFLSPSWTVIESKYQYRGLYVSLPDRPDSTILISGETVQGFQMGASLGVLPPASGKLTLEVRVVEAWGNSVERLGPERTCWKGAVTIPVSAGQPTATTVAAVNISHFSDPQGTPLSVELKPSSRSQGWPTQFKPTLDVRIESPLYPELDGCAFLAHTEILRNGTVVATSERAAELELYGNGTSGGLLATCAAVSGEEHAFELPRYAPSLHGKWEIRLKSDATAAAQRAITNKLPRYWTGEITIPVTDAMRPQN